VAELADRGDHLDECAGPARPAAARRAGSHAAAYEPHDVAMAARD
jgi:hypothetical protein